MSYQMKLLTKNHSHCGDKNKYGLEMALDFISLSSFICILSVIFRLLVIGSRSVLQLFFGVSLREGNSSLESNS